MHTCLALENHPLLLLAGASGSNSMAMRLRIRELSFTASSSSITTGTFLYSDHLSCFLVSGLTSTVR